MDGFELAILFTSAGAIVGAGLLKILVSAGKSFGIVPEHGRGVLYATALLAGALIGLAAWDASWLRDGISGQEVLVVILAWANLYSAAVGVHETAVKVQAVMTGGTNPSGPDR